MFSLIFNINYLYISVEEGANAFEIEKINPIFMFTFLYQMGADTVEHCMEHPEVIKFMKTKERFDICIVESFNMDSFYVRLSF